jgi:flagellar basal-body rod protein FlgB
MEPVYLFSLVNQHRSWLSARQAALAQNIANANTPGYKALDIAQFTTALDDRALQMASSSPLHMTTSSPDGRGPAQKPGETWETTHSGNSVSLEHEMIKSGEVRGAFSLDTNILKAFHGMWLASVKG